MAKSIGESALVETLSNGIADQYTSENIFKELRNQTDKARHAHRHCAGTRSAAATSELDESSGDNSEGSLFD